MTIYYDQFETWEGSFRELAVDLVGKEAIETLASSNFEFIEDAGDSVVRHTDIDTAAAAMYAVPEAH